LLTGNDAAARCHAVSLGSAVRPLQRAAAAPAIVLAALRAVPSGDPMAEMLSLLLTVAASFAPQEPQLPQLPAVTIGNGGALQRYVDFHTQFDRPGFCAVVGTLEKLKETKQRERLKDPAPLGSGGARVVLSGGQYFKSIVRTEVVPRAVFAGATKGNVEIECELQVYRTADGSEHWQTRTPEHCAIEEGTLALFVLVPGPGGRKQQLLNMIPFDAQADAGASPQDRFVDAMHDFVAINKRVHDLEAGIAAVTGARDDVSLQKAKQALTDLLAATVDLHQPEQRTLLQSRAGPFEQKARELLAKKPADKPAEKPAGDGK